MFVEIHLFVVLIVLCFGVEWLYCLYLLYVFIYLVKFGYSPLVVYQNWWFVIYLQNNKTNHFEV